MSEQNIYHKLLCVRNGFLQSNARKSGKNTYAGYNYFELKDIVPVIEPLCKEYGIVPIVSFHADTATMMLVNADNPNEWIDFSTPMAEASLKGAHAIQNLGAVQTYLRRYLYLTAFDIVEADALDATQGKDEPHISDKQKQMIKGLIKQVADAYNSKQTEVCADLENKLGCKVLEMTAKQGIEACKYLSKTLQAIKTA